MTGEQAASLEPALVSLLQRFRQCFRREKTFWYWQKYILGLMSDLKRKSVEPIALAAEVPVRTLQEFLSCFQWDHDRIDTALARVVADEHSQEQALVVLDASGHRKQGDKTPGVQRQYCGEVGKNENCVMGQHLLYTDNHPVNPFSCVLASDLYLPQSWARDRGRRREAKIPEHVVFRRKWEIALEQLERVVGEGVRFSYAVFDEDYGRVPRFWFGLDRLGLRGVGEVPADFYAWVRRPRCRSLRAEHASRRVADLVRHSPAFRAQRWRRLGVGERTRGRSRWRFKSVRVYLVASRHRDHRSPSIPTDRQYWLIVAENLRTQERKYVVSNAPAGSDPAELLKVCLGRWRVEKWFERAKQEAGLGAFEVRTYPGLIRHWLSSRMAMFFLARQTQRLRGEKSGHHGGAGSGRRQHAGRQDVADLAAILAGPAAQLPLLPVA
jgi:SRSO17 transposase